MNTTYTVIYIVLILALVTCTVLAKRSPRQCRGAVAWLETALIVPILASLLIMGDFTGTLTLIGYYMYFIGINVVLASLVNFTNTYCQGIGKRRGQTKRKPTVMYIALGADTFQMLLNPFFGHAFTLKAVTDGGGTSHELITYLGQTVHLVADYSIIFCVILIFTIASVITPKIHRERYTILLASMCAIGLLQVYYTFSGKGYERSSIGYGCFGVILFYFSIIHRPLRLLDQMLSSIISDLSDAFFVFDSTGTCIWANEQGCRLTGCEGTNYEEVDQKLRMLFGDPDANKDMDTRRTVGEGENARIYLLEEKKVRGSNGKESGSYLRVRDVTEVENEIKVRDEQIGQISQEAYKDALTGVGNKAAYNNKVDELNMLIKEGHTELAVVMVDMNNLKKINDEYGHKAGDLYIRGCCHMICEAFKHSPVYRIGGDEFVAVLQGQDYDERLQTVHDLHTAFEDACERTELEPWLRCSAAVGISELCSDDNSFELVFRRADKAMYDEKKLFKALHGSYRALMDDEPGEYSEFEE
ncbi:MAG: diguanylate cyclase [Ruminococcus sp.]|nr:diguanylate cyclase [Ruminococcus sp.]